MTFVETDVIVGVDGCKSGWLCIALEQNATVPAAWIAPTFSAVLERYRESACIAVDIPIGLPRTGSRACDVEARSMIKPRGSSVFPAPIRGVLNSLSYEEANSRHRTLSGKGFTQQAFAIIPKIAEVDTLVRGNPRSREIVHEVHPELSFRVWADRPMEFPKKDPDGLLARRALIDSEWPGAVLAMRKELPSGGYAVDDLHDAFAALWTARRIVAGTAIAIPGSPERDEEGLPMRMMA